MENRGAAGRPASLRPRDEVSGRLWVFSVWSDTGWGDWVSRARNQRRLPGAHGSWEGARLTPSRRTTPLCAQKGVCVRERRSCALKKKPSVFWETLGSAFQRHRPRFKPLRGRKSAGGRRGMRPRPRSSRERLAGHRCRPLGVARPSPPPRSSQPGRFQNTTLPWCMANCILLLHILAENHLLLECCAEVVAILTS